MIFLARRGKVAIPLKMTLLIAFVAIACVVLSLRLGCGRKSGIVRIALNKSAYYLPLMVAYDQHLFEKHGLKAELRFFNNNNDMINALLHGDAEISGLGSGGVFALQAASPGRVRFVYGQNSASYSLIVPSNSHITKLEDLKGKRIGTWLSPTPKALLALILDPRIGKDSFDVVPTDYRFLNQSMKLGDVDALFDTDIYTQQAIGSGDARYLSSNPVEEYILSPFFNGGGLIASDMQKSQPGLESEIRLIMDESIRFIRENNLSARMSLVTHAGVSVETARKTQMDRFLTLREVDIANAQKVADFFADQGVVAKRIKVAGMFR